jgi:hypothetical protein
MRFASAILILLVPCLAVAKTRHCGSIRGIVLDEYGNAVANAHVFADANRSGAGFLTAADKKTDDDGSFEFEQLPMGEYRVSADKPEAGYRSTRPDFFMERPPVVANLTPDNPSATVLLQFAAQAGAVTGRVTDATTGEALPFTVKLTPVAHLGSYESTAVFDGFDFTILIPAETDVMVEVRAEGHEHWVYADPAQPLQPISLRMRSGSELRLDIALSPRADSAGP